MIIDIHTHCFPDQVAKIAVPKLAEEAEIKAHTNGTTSGLLQSMKLAGIDYSVNQPIATRPGQGRNINNWAAKIQSRRSSGRLFSFGTVHPANPDWKKEILHIKKLGLKGIKLHPDYQEFFVNDEKIYPLYELALELDLILLFHAGIDIGLPEPCHCTPKRMREVIDTFKKGNIIAAHMGGYQYWDDVEKYLIGENIYLDTSYSLNFMNNRQFIRMLNNHGSKKILFGTDSPWGEQKSEVQQIKELGLDNTAEIDILGGNSAELLT